MKITEILHKENDNKGIILHKEGIFWRAYERSAYRFVSSLIAYRVKLRYYKNIKQDVVYIGFPVSGTDKILQLCAEKGYEIQKQDTELLIAGMQDDDGYEKWKNRIVQEGIRTEDEHKPKASELLKEIASYPLASKTPMEAQQFLYEIQLKINGTL